MGLATPTMSFECTISEGLAHIVLSQPDRGNPIDGAFCREFNLCMAELSERDDVRAVLISARGKLFSVGGDLIALAGSGDKLPQTVKIWTSDLHHAIVRMVRMRAPVVDGSAGQCRGRKRFDDGSGRHRRDRQIRAHFSSICQDRLHARQRFDDNRDAAHRAFTRATLFPDVRDDGCGYGVVIRPGRHCRRRRRGPQRGRKDCTRTGIRTHRGLWWHQAAVFAVAEPFAGKSDGRRGANSRRHLANRGCERGG